MALCEFYRQFCVLSDGGASGAVLSVSQKFWSLLKQLGEYPAESLYETIPNFHHTVKRFEAFAQSVQRDVKNRARLCRSEIEFALAREKTAEL